jgi:hypothetical protein
MLLDTRNKNMYGLRVGTSTAFEKFGHSLFKGDETTPYGHDIHTYVPSDAPRNKNIYSSRVENSTVFKT